MPDVAPASPASTRSTATAGSESPLPLIVDLGKHPRKDVKRLREGRGKLLTEIAACLDELKGAGKLPAGTQPVVILVREKRRKTGLWPLA
jgi:hypothetical protein